MIAMHATTPTTQPATTTATLEKKKSSLPVCALSLTLEEVTVVDITDVLVVVLFEFDPVYVVVDVTGVTNVDITDVTMVGMITDVTLSLPSPVHWQ